MLLTRLENEKHYVTNKTRKEKDCCQQDQKRKNIMLLTRLKKEKRYLTNKTEKGKTLSY